MEFFADDGFFTRAVGALMLETSDEWAVARRYMSLEAIARIVSVRGAGVISAPSTV